MSVLLDALKKAAEEKKNLEQEKPASNQELSLSDDANIADTSDENTSLNEKVTSNKLSLGETVEADSFNRTEDDLISQPEVTPTEKNEFTFQLADEKKPALEAQDDLSEIESLPEFDVETLDIDETHKEELSLASSDPDQKSSELTITVNDKDRNLNLKDENVDYLANNEISDIDSLISTLDVGVPENEEVNLLSGIQEVADPLSIIESDISKDPNFDSLELSENQKTLDKKQSTEFDKQSFDWSLDDLPGYSVDALETQPTAISNNLEHNSILVNGANTPPKKAKSKYATSSKVIVTLFVFLAFVLIGFYGIIYFQEQNEKLEKSMMKYNISSLNIKPKEESPVNTDNKITESPTKLATEQTVIEVIPKNEALNTEIINSTDSETILVSQIAKTNLKEQTAPSNIKPELDNIALEPKGSAKQIQDATKTAPDVSQPDVKTSKTMTIDQDKALTVAKPKTVKKLASTNRTTKRAATKPQPIVVKINKTKSLLAQGYEAYNSGNYVKARQLFNSVLDSDPENTAALMAMGAISVVNTRYVNAMNYYEQVLRIKPNNLDALEAIANLSGKVQLNRVWEEQLMRVAEMYPQSGALQNAVGNSYARNNDWLKAQSAYFNAVVNNSLSPDYMLNLAVSYDHLGEYKLASQYYTKALGFAVPGKVSFDIHEVKSRLISIKQLMLAGG